MVYGYWLLVRQGFISSHKITYLSRVTPYTYIGAYLLFYDIITSFQSRDSLLFYDYNLLRININ